MNPDSTFSPDMTFLIDVREQGASILDSVICIHQTIPDSVSTTVSDSEPIIFCVPADGDFDLDITAFEDDSGNNCQYNAGNNPSPSDDDCLAFNLFTEVFDNLMDGMDKTYSLECTFDNNTFNHTITLRFEKLEVAEDDILFTDGAASICENETLTIFSGIPSEWATLEWTASQGGMIDEDEDNGDSIVVSAGGRYTLSAMVNNECTIEDSIDISEGNTPAEFSIGGAEDNKVCQNTGTNLTAENIPNGATYLWKLGENPIGAPNTPLSIDSELYIGDNTVTLEVTDGVCTAEFVDTIEVLCNPEIDVVGDSSLCEGDSTTMSVDFAGDCDGMYNWSNIDDDTSSITIDSAGVYKVTVSFNGCPEQTDSTTVTAVETPEVSISADNLEDGVVPFCQGSSVTLTASDGNTATSSSSNFEWSANNATGENLEVTTQDTYTVTATANGCTDVDTVVVEERCAPPISIDASMAAVCEGDSITLTAIPGDCSLLDTITYNWSQEEGNMRSITSTQPEGDSVVYAVTVSYKHDDITCSQSDSVNTEGIPIPEGMDKPIDLVECGDMVEPIDLCAALKEDEDKFDDLSFKYNSSEEENTADGCLLEVPDGTPNTLLVTPVNEGCEGDPFELSLSYVEGTEVDDIESAYQNAMLEYIPMVAPCRGTQGLNVSLPDTVSDPTLTYKWATNRSGVEWVQSEEGSRALLFFPENTLSSPLSLFIEASDVCDSTICKSFPLVDINDAVVSTPSVIFDTSSYSLIVLDNTAESYQWGFEDKKTLEGDTFPDGINQGLLLDSELGSHEYDHDSNYYYVRLTTTTGCTTKAYYNPPDLSAMPEGESCAVLSGTDDERLSFEFGLFPNPNNGQYQVKWGSDYRGSVLIELFDLYGRSLHRSTATKNSWKWQYQLNHGALPSGVYLLRLRLAEGQHAVRRVYIQNR